MLGGSKGSREGTYEAHTGELPGISRRHKAAEWKGKEHDSQRERQALVVQMPRTVLSRLTLLSTIIATLVVAGSAGINPI